MSLWVSCCIWIILSGLVVKEMMQESPRDSETTLWGITQGFFGLQEYVSVHSKNFLKGTFDGVSSCLISLDLFRNYIVYIHMHIYVYLYNWTKMGLFIKEVVKALGKSQYKMVPRHVCEREWWTNMVKLRKKSSFLQESRIGWKSWDKKKQFVYSILVSTPSWQKKN